MVPSLVGPYIGPMDNSDETTDATTETTGDVTGATTGDRPVAPARTGLHRSSANRVVGGVAGGLGERFDIDPHIVRVIFVVLSIVYGLGAAIYLAMWAILPLAPRASGAIEVPLKAPEPRWHWLRYALIIAVSILAVIVTSSALGHPHFGRSLGLFWLAFLVVLAVITLRIPARRLHLGRFIALMFLAALSFLILLAGVFYAVLDSTGVPVDGGNGLRTWQPTTLAQVQHTYRIAFGRATLNFSHVSFPKSGYSVVASVAVGYLLIELPANVVVDVMTHVGIGSVIDNQYNQQFGWASAPFTPVPARLTSVASQSAAPHLTVDAQVGFGKIEFVRAVSGPTG
jgi:phage shock protein PspC (stress-responsive transcriptional regulator)